MPLRRKVLYAGESSYGKYKVVDTVYNGRQARVLYGSQRSPQSGAATDGDPELLFSYNQRFFELVMSMRPKRILVIGGGAFMLPIASYHQFPKLKIDVIEIDSLLVKLAKDFFHLPESKRLQVHIEDGASFVARTKNTYDLIIIDAFSGYNIPPHLYNHTVIEQYKKILSKNGAVAMNFISTFSPKRKRLAHELIASFGESFAEIALYQADSEYPVGDKQNHLLVASNKPIHFDYLHSANLL